MTSSTLPSDRIDAERYEQARTAFKTAPHVNPDFGWVRHVLLPKLTEKME
jgi:hypothetical protein